MKIIVTTSNNYLHLIPVFCYLFNKYWSSEQEVEIVGYSPLKIELPDNFTFHSMGTQGPVSEWSTDLRKYFESIEDEWFIWLMDDTLLRRKVLPFDIKKVSPFESGSLKGVGRIDLTNDLQKREHSVFEGIVTAGLRTRYRLSTQPSAWSKEFLLKYLTPGFSPWDFETQDPVCDGYYIMGFETPPVKHNEGVRKSDPHKLDLNGFGEEDVNHINKLLENGKD